jgi:hypothetical protein
MKKTGVGGLAGLVAGDALSYFYNFVYDISKLVNIFFNFFSAQGALELKPK